MVTQSLGSPYLIWRVAVFTMNPYLLPIAVGAVLGFLSGLGTGGGSLLILWLTLVQDFPQAEARIINLLFFIPSALISCVFRLKQGCLQIRKVLPAMVAGSICAGLFAYMASGWDTQILKNAFGVLLLFTGVKELLYKPKMPNK